MNIIFFGSSEFSIPILSILAAHYSIVQVVTTPEKKRGRGQKLSGTVVKDFALAQKLSCSEPEKLSDPQFVNRMKNLIPDFIIIASYGKLVPASIFTLPKIAPLNVHPSLLPRHRGASPIQRAIVEGDQKTGVSIAEVTKDLDAGDLFAQIETPLDPNENASQLSQRLSQMAAGFLLKLLEEIKAGKIRKIPQDISQVTYAKKITKDEGQIDWKQSNIAIHNQIRAYDPWPGAFAFFRGKRLKILESQLVQKTEKNLTYGCISSIEQIGVTVQTSSDQIRLKRVQLEGRKEMNAYEFALGQRIKKGDCFE